MANEIKIGNLTISNFKVGSGDCTIYLGNTLLYPTTPSYKWLATYFGGTTSSAACDASSAITRSEIELTDLESVTIGNCVTSIGNEAFNYCYSLTSITIPNSVTSIGENAFNYCPSLPSIVIPNSVTSIGGAAFKTCYALTSITIPDSVTSIGASVFNACTSLSSCIIGSGITSISNSTFNQCERLTSIDIPSGVTSIGEGAFMNCTGLTSITVNATTPPTLGSMAFDSTNNCPIYVPAQSVSAYKAASGWSTYASRLQPIQ